MPSEKFSIDKALHAYFSHFTGWLSPRVFSSALVDWLTYFGQSADKKIDLALAANEQWLQLIVYLIHVANNKNDDPVIKGRASDKRFKHPLWNQFPFSVYSQFFLCHEQLWDQATTGVRGVSAHHEYLVNFITRQLLDVISPSNFPLTNPEVISASINQFGFNFVNGFNNWLEDVTRSLHKQPPVGSEAFKVGENVAITPGKVIYRNHLIELIQYEPATRLVYAEPILIIPAWIMKYYILDLSPHNSMANYLVNQGHTVFMISWRNPDSADSHLTMEDYIKLGILAAIQAINQCVPQQKIHAVGYCIGGTLLMLAAASLGKQKNNPLKSITLFASQIDFTEAGELLLFIDESQLTYLEDIMSEKGYLDGAQMAGTFNILQSIDLVWSKLILDYLLGQRRPINDLMAWDYDTTRLPATMQSEYLRKLFLHNQFAEGNYRINDVPISLQDIRLPIFAVSALRDHVAPWQSVYKIHNFTPTDITFVLTSGGHNSGVVNEPGHPGRSYQLMTHKKNKSPIAPEEWLKKAPNHEGSWWPAWQQWLADCSGKKMSPPNLGNPEQGYPILCDAPGTYVFQK